MFLTTDEILHFNLCDEWNESKIIDFMNTQPYIKPGEKTLEQFIESADNNEIEYEDIFWIFLQKLNRTERYSFCHSYINHIFHMMEFDLDFIELFETYLYQIDITDQFLADIKSDELDIISQFDYCNKSRFLNYLHELTFEYFYKHSDLKGIVKSLVYNLNYMSGKDYFYTVNYMKNILN